MSDDPARAALRQLPSTDATVQSAKARFNTPIEDRYLTAVVRQVISATRDEILHGDASSIDRFDSRLEASLSLMTTVGVRTVVNATGVIVHTNLGRSPVSAATAAAMAEAARNYLPLEVRLETGDRGGRGEEVATLMRALTGAESTLAVNNNAAAILLTLSAHCAGRQVIISRGEAVEIGGGFRIPDVLRQSGAHLVEVGTTNRTSLGDYANAVTDDTAAILTVHASNFEISGFTSKPRLAELAGLAHERAVLLIEDVGSGCLVDTEDYGLAHEPTLGESITAGVDVVTASGDKLLGGPQAGLILGSEAAVSVIRRHPLARAVRTDKTIQHGLAATLRHYLRGEQDREVPIWWMMSRTGDELRERARGWLDEIDDDRCALIETTSVTGGGSLPGKSQPSSGIAIHPRGATASDFAARLRTRPEAIFPRVEDDRVIIDARTILPEQDGPLVSGLRAALDSS